MSNLGMERHEHPDFEYQDLNDADGPSFWWKNPYYGRREKIANLWWPEHPDEATEAIEALFENLKLTYEPSPPGTEPPQSINTHDALQAENERLREQVKELREALGPFAKAADIKLCGDWMDDESIARTDISHHIKFGHLRCARTLLTPGEKP